MYEIPEDLKDKIYFVIPAYNEEKVIGGVLRELIENGFKKIIVVDDGSSDKTFEVVDVFKNVILLRHVINRGQGAALKTGLLYASKISKCKYVVTFDSDGQHQISDLWKFIKVLEEDKEIEVVFGSRFLLKETKKLVPFKKRILLKGAIIVTWFLSSILLTDAHNGYRVFRKETIKKINFNYDGFEHASEIVDELSKNKIKFKEVPVYIDYTDYSMKKGQKMMNSLRILIKMLFKNV